eukprot:1142755-Pelagomonas_calceolata.AAC.1
MEVSTKKHARSNACAKHGQLQDFWCPSHCISYVISISNRAGLADSSATLVACFPTWFLWRSLVPTSGDLQPDCLADRPVTGPRQPTS